MNKQQLLLIQLMEELAETQQACSKALRFGGDDGYSDGDTTNFDDIAREFQEAIAIYSILENTAGFPVLSTDKTIEIQTEEIAKATKYLDYSREKGVLQCQET